MLRPQRPPAVRAASRATRCWDGCAGAQQLGRALSTCSSSRLQAKGIGRLRHHKVQLVYGELAIAIEVESLKVVSVASLSGSGIVLNCSDVLGGRI